MKKHHWPAEWEKQSAILLVWPHSVHAWKDNLEETERSYLAMVHAISQHQTVIVVARDQAHWQHIQAQLKPLPLKYPVIHELIATNDTWARDTGPISMYHDNRAIALDFEFNAWGGKFEYDLDNQMNSHLLASLNFKEFDYLKINMVLEGGSIESDGHGTLLTTQSCLSNSNRNPAMSSQDIHKQLQQLLNVNTIIELEVDPLPGDDTDGHIDTLARFCDAQTICYLQDEKTPSLIALEQQLKALKNHRGDPYRLVPLPYAPTTGTDNQPVPATYANFLIINGAVLVPEYGLPYDQLAQQQIKTCFADRNIYPIPARPFIEQGGSVHCLTMQIPA